MGERILLSRVKHLEDRVGVPRAAGGRVVSSNSIKAKVRHVQNRLDECMTPECAELHDIAEEMRMLPPTVVHDVGQWLPSVSTC